MSTVLHCYVLRQAIQTKNLLIITDWITSDYHETITRYSTQLFNYSGPVLQKPMNGHRRLFMAGSSGQCTVMDGGMYIMHADSLIVIYLRAAGASRWLWGTEIGQRTLEQCMNVKVRLDVGGGLWEFWRDARVVKWSWSWNKTLIVVESCSQRTDWYMVFCQDAHKQALVWAINLHHCLSLPIH